MVAPVDDIKPIVVAVGLAIHREEFCLGLQKLPDRPGQEAVPKVHDQDHVRPADQPAKLGEKPPFRHLVEGLVTDQVQGEKLGELLALGLGLDKPLFDDGDAVLHGHMAGQIFPVGLERFPQPRLAAGDGRQADVGREFPEVPDHGKGPATVGLLAEEAGGQDAVFGGQPLHVHGGVAVKDDLPDHQHAQAGKRVDFPPQRRRIEAAGEPVAKFLHLGLLGLEIVVEEAGGTENHRADVTHFAAQFFHRGHVVPDVAGDVVGRILVFQPLAVDVGTNQLDGLHGGGVRHHHHMIHRLKGGERLSPKGIVEKRATRALVHMGSSRKSDNQDIPEFFGLLEMDDVAGMNQIKGSVALDETTALPAQVAEQGGRPRQGQNFMVHGLWM